jgi:tetratricopeptide (TPR) repeat protein
MAACAVVQYVGKPPSFNILINLYFKDPCEVPSLSPLKRQIYRGFMKINRNSLCPCGSGKKYKKCCDQNRKSSSQAQTLRLKPNLADTHFNLGLIASQQGKLEDAIRSYKRVLELEPKHADACFNLAYSLRLNGELNSAIDAYKRVIKINPKSAAAYNNLAFVLRMVDRLEEAIEACNHAIALEPEMVEAHNNLGITLIELGKFDEALSSLDYAIGLNSEHAEAHFNRSMILLLKGDFDNGLQEFEWRWKSNKIEPTFNSYPMWDGSSHREKTILLHAEQGLGDTIQFIRYAPLVKERIGRVVVKCQKPLVKLLKSCSGIDELITDQDMLPPFNFQAPMMSLPLIFKTSIGTIPDNTPYLDADITDVTYWQEELKRFKGLKIGIVWQGNPNHFRDRYRSIPLEYFTPLFDLDGVHYFSLQKDNGMEQLDKYKDKIIDLTRLTGRSLDFPNTAAVIKNLDLVISPDTAIAHLVGALGVPIYLPLSFIPDWRWLLERDDTPWYKSMRLFRQDRQKDWTSVFKQILRAIA